MGGDKTYSFHINSLLPEDKWHLPQPISNNQMRQQDSQVSLCPIFIISIADMPETAKRQSRHRVFHLQKA